jgi:tetratricopeptide (TPR) repeat protein
VDDVPAEVTIQISTESLLMEGARRIDEWSRIADKVPHLGVIPTLAPVHDDHPSLLDLLPNEWEVLTIIDGTRDLRAIAAVLGRSEFDVAKIAYGLVTTGVIALKNPERVTASAALPLEDARPHVERSERALAAGNAEDALSAARAGIAADPGSAPARLAAARALTMLGRHADASDELRRALEADPLDAEIHREIGYAAARKGELDEAVANWESFLRMAPQSPEAPKVRAAIESAQKLREMLESKTSV